MASEARCTAMVILHQEDALIRRLPTITLRHDIRFRAIDLVDQIKQHVLGQKGAIQKEEGKEEEEEERTTTTDDPVVELCVSTDASGLDETCLEVTFSTVDMFDFPIVTEMEQIIGAYQTPVMVTSTTTLMRTITIDKFSAAAVGAWLCYLPQTYMHEIVTGLWLGSIEAADDLPTLTACKIGVVVNLSGRDPLWLQKLQQDVARRRRIITSINNITVTSIEILDHKHANMLQHLDSLYNVIASARASDIGVLVNCQQGKSRSATVVIHYLMATEHKSFEAVLRHVQAIRSCVQPNEGFQHQLRTQRLLPLATTSKED